MNKKIKSIAEIIKDIDNIYLASKSEAALVKNLVSYIDNISGKELVSESNIKDILFRKIWENDTVNETGLRNNKKLNKVIPNLKYFEYYVDVVSDPVPVLRSLTKFTHHILRKKLAVDIAFKCDSLNKYRKNETSYNNILQNCMVNNKSFKKLCNFIFKNEDVAHLLFEYVGSVKQKYYLKIIVDKVIPLNSVLIFFDYSKTISQNTQDLYILLNKKFTRQSIQLMIQANLNNIREGKYLNYNLL